MDYGLRVTGFGLRVAGYGLWAIWLMGQIGFLGTAGLYAMAMAMTLPSRGGSGGGRRS